MQRRSIYDRPVRLRPEINLSGFSFLFAEVVEYFNAKRDKNLEKHLETLGESMGPRIVELAYIREKNTKRITKHTEMLEFIVSVIWPMLFCKKAEPIQQLLSDPSKGHKYTSYVIYDNDPPVIKYIPFDPQDKNVICMRFVGGIVKSILEYAGFPCKVEVMHPETDRANVFDYPKTAFIIDFDESVYKREPK